LLDGKIKANLKEMLPPEVDTLIRESIDVYLKAQGFRPPRFGQRLLARSFGGQTIQPAKVAAITFEEIETVSTGLVNCIHKVIEKMEITPYEGLQNDLLQVFDSEFDTCADGIRKFASEYLTRLSSNPDAAGWFDQKMEDARQARHLELKLLAAGVLKAERNDSDRILYNSKNEPVAMIRGGD
jgi:hypothetical protein